MFVPEFGLVRRERQRMLDRRHIVRNTPSQDNARDVPPSLAAQRAGLVDTEAATDFTADGVTARIKARTNLVRDQRWKNDAASGWRFPPVQERSCQFVNRINDSLRLRQYARRADHPVDSAKTSTGGPYAAEESMQRVDQDRKIGLTCVAWPHEHRQRSQFNRRIDDWPEIAHLKFESISLGQVGSFPCTPVQTFSWTVWSHAGTVSETAP